MRHQSLKKESEITTAWPRPTLGLVGDAIELERPAENVVVALPTPAAEPSDDTAAAPATSVPDVPVAVGGLVAGTYLGLIGILFAFMARSPLAAFCIAIAAVFVVIFLAVPTVFLRVEAEARRRPSFGRFMHEGMDTLTGRVGGRDALLQMLIVPVFLALGLTAMGIAGLVYIG